VIDTHDEHAGDFKEPYVQPVKPIGRSTRRAFAIRSSCAFRSRSVGISNNLRMMASRAALSWCSLWARRVSQGDG